MHHPSRPPNRSNGSTAVTATQESGEVPPPAVAAGASARASRSDNGGERSSAGVGEPDSPSWCRTKPISPFDGLGVFQTRSIFHIPRRTSSGYFSFDGESQPNSPLSPRQLTADKATQTPSPSCQVIQHALQRKPNEYGGGPGTHQQHGSTVSASSTRPQNTEGNMQAAAIGQELRRIGDDFNRLLLLRGLEDRRREVVIHPNPLLPIQEPAILFCFSLLLLLIGRIIYLQGSTDSQDPSQV